MKKIVVGIFALITLISIKTQGAEILPEYFLMEKLVMFMDVAPSYTSNDGSEKLKAIQVDKDVMKILQTTENPFYVIDSSGNKKMVRMGDYLTSPLSLSSIYATSKVNFEEKFKGAEKNSQVVDKAAQESMDKINISDIDEGKVANPEEEVMSN